MIETPFTELEKNVWLKRHAKAKKIAKRKTPKRPRKKGRKRIHFPKKKGRKPKPRKLRKFLDTDVGHYMYVYAPMEYHFLTKFLSSLKKEAYACRSAITPDDIENLALHSSNTHFRTASFRKAFIAYRKYGPYQKEKAEWNLRDAVFFAKNTYLVYKSLKLIEGSI